MMRRKVLAAFLCAGLVIGTGYSAYADKHGYAIDPEAMKEVELASSFEVQVTEKKVVEECLDTDSMDFNTDVLVLTVTNAGSTPIRSIKVKYVAYNDENITTDVASSRSIAFNMMDEAHEIFSAVSGEKETVEPGETCQLMQAVNFSLFTGVRAMVQEYTLEDGTVVSNPDYPTWESMAFGLVSGDVTELD